MTKVDDVSPSELGLAAGSALREILTRATASTPIVNSVLAEPSVAWSVFRSDGWDMLGVAESDDGAGAGVRELAHLAQIWGEFLVPSPLIPTMMAKRWSSAARAINGPVTVAIATAATPGRTTTPFGGEPGVQLLVGSSDDATITTAEGIELDDYTPSLRLATCTQETQLTTLQARELSIVWAGESVGCARRALAEAIEYAKQREQFGQPIGRFQAVKHHLASAHILAERAESAVLWGSIEIEDVPRLAVHAMDLCLRTIEIAIQVHGGLGFTWEMGLHMYLRHVVSLRELTIAALQ